MKLCTIDFVSSREKIIEGTVAGGITGAFDAFWVQTLLLQATSS